MSEHGPHTIEFGGSERHVSASTAIPEQIARTAPPSAPPVAPTPVGPKEDPNPPAPELPSELPPAAGPVKLKPGELKKQAKARARVIRKELKRLHQLEEELAEIEAFLGAKPRNNLRQLNKTG